MRSNTASEPGVTSPIAAAGEERSDFDAVPLIDFSGMLSGTADAKRRVAAELRDACIDVGFFYIANHGVPQDLVDAMFDMAPRLFGLPLADKMRWHVKLVVALSRLCGDARRKREPGGRQGRHARGL